MSRIVLGIDIAKKKMDVVLVFEEKYLNRVFENTAKGFRLLDGWLRSLRIEQVHACLEATGRYSEPVAAFLFENGHRVSMVNPLRIKGFAVSDLKRNKTDSADARTIADFCLAKNPADWHPSPPEVKQLQALVRRIEVLDEIRHSEQNRLEAAPRPVAASLRRVIRNLEKEIEALKRLVKEHIDNHPDLKVQSELLQSIPGIGEKTATTLLSEIEFSLFDSARSLAAFAGLTPCKKESGLMVYRTRLSKLGNVRIRKALYFPAITAIKYNLLIKNFAERLDENGKQSKQVICASMRKLLHIAFGVLKNNQPFDQNVQLYV